MSAAVGKSRVEEFDDDVILIERFLHGDEASFEQLYRKYYDKVFAIAKGVLLDSDEAADAVQEIFTLVYRHLRRFDRRSRFSTWLFRVAVNRSIQQARKVKYKSRQVPLDEASGRASPDESPEEAAGKSPCSIAACACCSPYLIWASR
ncbi:MAG: sigma-70 family RNA polymerase sigma factor [Fimbriimonadales bacterium]